MAVPYSGLDGSCHTVKCAPGFVVFIDDVVLSIIFCDPETYEWISIPVVDPAYDLCPIRELYHTRDNVTIKIEPTINKTIEANKLSLQLLSRKVARKLTAH